MAYALVGAMGAVSTGTSGAALTPAYDAGAARTANNLLLCWVSGWTTGTAATPATPAGWTQAKTSSATGTSGQSCSTLFFKVAAGADGAPAIALATGMTWAARLAEYSGGASVSPLDQSGAVAAGGAGASPGVPTNAGVDASTGELVAYVATEFNTATATSTMGTPPNPTNFTVNDVTNNASSSQSHWLMGYGFTTANAVADKNSITFESASANLSAVIASFKLLAATSLPDLIMAPAHR